jgi:hypothetical protein
VVHLKAVQCVHPGRPNKQNSRSAIWHLRWVHATLHEWRLRLKATV